MTVEEARDILIQHNKWRRDNSVPNSETMVNPTELGIAIDVAIDVLMEHIDKYSLNEESYANYSAQLSLPF
jgi:hypothetical protein